MSSRPAAIFHADIFVIEPGLALCLAQRLGLDEDRSGMRQCLQSSGQARRSPQLIQQPRLYAFDTIQFAGSGAESETIGRDGGCH